jgi:two-component system phosphate regulon sensor histidine kinase PhoR
MIDERVAGVAREDLQLLAVREILRATAVALPLDEILTVVANMAIIVFDATTAWFMLPEDGRFRATSARGEFASALTGSTCDPETSLACAAAMGEKPVTLQPRQVDPADPILRLFARQEEPVVLVPLRRGDETLGILGAAVRPEAALDISFLVTLAGQAAGAISNARLREETRTWRQRLDAVFARMAEPVLVFDPEGRLALMNESAEELLAQRGVQVGDTITELYRKAGLTDPRGRSLRPEEGPTARALRGERVENLEEDLPVPGAPTRHLLTSAMPLGGDGRVEGAVVVWRDITYIRELERMRAEFLSLVSHELRSPLTSILGYAQLLRRQLATGQTPTELDRRLEVIVEQGKRVNALVEDLLDASRAEVGRLTLQMEPVDLAGLVRKTVDDSRVTAPRHLFRVDLPDELPAVRADPGRIEQVLRNLLSNAVKFSNPGTTVTVRVRPQPGRLLVSVSDEGVGISREDMETLFLPFHRVRRVGGREVKGVGLGLFISRSIVEAHGGDMWVHSQLGQGSTFYFTLPLA